MGLRSPSEQSSRRHQSASELLTLEYFEAEPGAMPVEAFQQHLILLNLREEPQRVEN